MRLSLDLAEEGIAVDPHHRHRRHEVDGIVYDMTEAAVIVAFVVIDAEAVLLSFVDLFDR